jgi:hypothetical protein
MFSNYANAFSTIDVPAVNSAYGLPQKVNVNVTDSNDWEITPEGDLICRNPGKWRILAQYQLVHLAQSGDAIALIDGYFAINDQPVAASDATNSVSKYAPKNVLPIELAGDFNFGDKLSIFAASTNTNAGICRGYQNNGAIDRSGNLTNFTNIDAPSVIVSASKIPSHLLC